MGRILEKWRVHIAVLFSAVLVVGAYIIARGIESPPVAQASAETALLQAIATKDSDSDGLPDWEESLYGTSPNNSDSNNLGMTDGEAVAKGLIVPKAIADISTPVGASPGSLDENGLPTAPADGTITDAFAKTFFSLYLEAKQANNNADLSEADLAGISKKALDSLSSSLATAPDFKSANDLAISGSGASALKAFAMSAEAILLKNTNTATTSEIDYLQYAVEGNDSAAISQMLSIAKGYRGSAAGLAVLSVPAVLATDDLALINAMARLSTIITDFARVNDDPLATILALKQYPQAFQSIETAFTNIGALYKTAGISLSSGAPGASFVNLIANITPKP